LRISADEQAARYEGQRRRDTWPPNGDAAPVIPLWLARQKLRGVRNDSRIGDQAGDLA
jgi:hypothetical protein